MSDKDRQHLEKMLDRVIDMIKFAEAKHAVLIGFSGAAIFGVLRLFLVIENPTIYFELYSYAFLGFTITAIIISLLSFVPIVDELNDKAIESISKPNLAFFGHALRFDGENYLRLIQGSLSENSGGSSEMNLFLAKEVVINSRIVATKFILFRRSLVCVICAVLTPLIAFLAWKIIRKKIVSLPIETQ